MPTDAQFHYFSDDSCDDQYNAHTQIPHIPVVKAKTFEPKITHPGQREADLR